MWIVWLTFSDLIWGIVFFSRPTRQSWRIRYPRTTRYIFVLLSLSRKKDSRKSCPLVHDLFSLYWRFMLTVVKSKPFENTTGSSNSWSYLNGYLICIDIPDPCFGANIYAESFSQKSSVKDAWQGYKYTSLLY